MKNSMMAVGATLMATLSGHAQRVNPEVVQVVYEVFSLSKSDAAASQREALTDREVYAKMVAGLEDGKVKQEKLQAIRSRSGQRSTSEHVSEFLYATEYEPPELPNSVGVSVTSAAVTKEKPTGKEVIDALKNGPGWSEGPFPATPATGTSFDTMPMGDSLEVEASIGENPAEIALRVSASHIELTGFETWGEFLAEVKMPRFAVKKVQTGLTVNDRVPTLIGTVSPTSEAQANEVEERVWFAFVTTTVIEVKE